MFSVENQQSASGRGNPSTSASYTGNGNHKMYSENTAAAPVTPRDVPVPATGQDEYKIILPRFPPGALCVNSVFLHADLTGRPYRAVDFRDELRGVVDLNEVVSLGQFQMSHVWMATLASPEATEKLKTAKELSVKGKKCLIIDSNSKDVKLKLLWLPSYLEDKKIVDALAPFGGVRSIAREKWRVPGMENMETLNREVCLTLHDTATSEDVPQLLKVYGIQSLLVMSGRPPLCLRSRKVGHIRRQCRTPKCARCNRFGHESDECFSSDATVLRGSGNDPDANPELLMDISEVVDASGDVLSTQAQPRETLPQSSGGSKTQDEKEASEILQDTTPTEAVKAASQEEPINDISSTPETEVPKQSAVPADGFARFDNKYIADPSAMDLSPSTFKDSSDTKRKKHSPDTIASKRKTSLAH
ncbi:uncharacterized protein ISCGN_011230 [Ixodes scapularis]